ncbi:MAG: hypothetical protein AAF327_00705 [Cyanobacteria bacterium P01_A01_bin.37]
MMVVLSNATYVQLAAIAKEYHIPLATPIVSSCGSFVHLEDVSQTIRYLKPFAPRVAAIRDLVQVLTEASLQLDPIIPCDDSEDQVLMPEIMRPETSLNL